MSHGDESNRMAREILALKDPVRNRKIENEYTDMAEAIATAIANATPIPPMPKDEEGER